jgi:hypothetical protein
MSKEITWDRSFGPSYTPEEMLKLGVFEGKYINNIKGIPSEWKKINKVLGPKDDPDPTINHFGVKSRQPLSVWKKNGWIKTDPNGWFAWYINYYLGRRLDKEDEWQINRWRSFVARHQGQINADPKSKNKDHRLVQKQALLQWGWDWEESFNDKTVLENAKSISRKAGCSLEPEKTISQESKIITPPWTKW